MAKPAESEQVEELKKEEGSQDNQEEKIPEVAVEKEEANTEMVNEAEADDQPKESE
jgi:hypothetical protein